MKTFVSIIGMLTIAQWLFVGLLYGFLHVQDKTTPETMAKLHDFPVVGGYFPKVKAPTKEEEDAKYGDELRKRIIDARRQWSLPASYTEAEFVELMTEIRERSERLKSESRKLEKTRLEVRSMIDEINRREQAVISKTENLTKRERELIKTEAEVALRKRGQEERIASQELKHNRDMARWLNLMEPQAAAEKLLSKPEDESPAETRARFVRAARLLALMDEEQAAAVVELIDPIDWVKIEEAKLTLPVIKK